MKSLIVGAILAGSLLPSYLCAQRGGMMPRGGGFTGGAYRPGNGPLAPGHIGFPGLHYSAWHSSYHAGRQFYTPALGYAGFYGGEYGGYSGDNYQPQPSPSIIVVMPQVEVAQPPAPPPPVHSKVQEYHWSEASEKSAATTFSLVAKDRRVDSAVAVWVQDGMIYYVAPDGSSHQIPLGAVDREATRLRNAENQLTLSLPAGD